MTDATSILAQHAQRISACLRDFLRQQADQTPRQLIEAIEYSLLAGGKRIRPALVLESWRACRATALSEPTALAAAAAVELVHTFSLVHDDLPAMDDDDLRRGKPTSHKVFGEAMAILAGDAMVTLAFELLARRAEAELAPLLVAELARAAGPTGMIGGQVLDIGAENQTLSLAQLQQVHRMKTGALLVASCRMGAIAARADREKLDALTSFAEHLGLAFQIVDDILDVTASPEQLGKATNKDRTRGKNTYPALLGLDASRSEARRQLDAAIAALANLDQAADGLRSLASFAVERQM
ncbi:polyprenyl synthetase family protein [Fontivita pretiosa]|uniref:polyprenyl synthetase family protein n=1 Tax=Fontivita pretiosa TaxID=2989684 RepID=UPI003D16CDB3